MRIALIASPFISVPPRHYGGTELFISQLAEGLKKLGADVVVYANGASTVGVEVRYLYESNDWPIQGELYGSMKDLNHTSWAIADCWKDADIIHLNNAPGLALSRFGKRRWVYTMHHPHIDSLTEFYKYYPYVEYVTISDHQRRLEPLENVRTIHHGVDLDLYRLQTTKQPYLAFLGRIAPMKGTHNAIAIAKKSGIPLKIAGEIQPLYKEYFDSKVKPHIDGKFIEYVGEADLAAKDELLGNAMAMLFPIEWDEPFGLVLIESMAAGTPVIAFPGGSVREIVRDGISGFVCESIDDAVSKTSQLATMKPNAIRAYAQQHFSIERMVSDYMALYREMIDEAPVRELDEIGKKRVVA